MKPQKQLRLEIFAVILAWGANAGCASLAKVAGFTKTETGIPTIRVVREPLEVKVHALGELRPSRTSTLVAPPIAGGMLQIIHIVKSGTKVKEGDIVAEFDPTEQEYNLEQAQSQLAEAEQQLRKMKADQAVRVAQEAITLMTAQFNVRRAEFQAQGNELLGEIDAKKNLIALEEAKRRLDQLQKDVKSRASSDMADLAVQNNARMRAQMAMKLAQQNIENMILRAPIGGIVVLGQNMDSLMSGSGSLMLYTGMEIPEFKSGDQAYPGRTIAVIQDVELMEIQSRVTENDRGSLDVGLPIDARVDSQPLKRFSGKIKSLALSAGSSSSVSFLLDYLEGMSTRSFDATFELDPEGEVLNPGVTTRVTINATRVEDALSLPRQALFQKAGKDIVFLKQAEGWHAQEVHIKYLTESRAVIEGLAEGTEVALVNPELQMGKTGRKAGPLVSMTGGSPQ